MDILKVNNKKLLVWILQTGEPLHIDDENARPMRAMNLSNKLVEAGHNVVLWSSSFYHQEKRHRSKNECSIRISDNLEIRLIPSMGYKRNIGLKRLADHAQMAYHLKKKLKREKKFPDVVFIGYPPIETAAVISRWCKKNNIPSLLDVKDQWPTFFIDKLPESLKVIGKAILWPYFYLAKRTMNDVTGISTMTNGYLSWICEFSGRTQTETDGIFSLTTPVGEVTDNQLKEARRWWDIHRVKDDGRYRVCFVGSLSPAFDFKPVREAAMKLNSKKNFCEFIICGDGASADEIMTMMSGLPNVVFPGWIDRPKIETLAERCQGFLAPYLNVDNFTQNLPNKIIDALSLGLPILSPLQGETATLIDEYGVGLRYGTDTGKKLSDCIIMLIQKSQLQKKLSKNALQLYKKNYAFEIVYGNLVHHLENMVKF